MVCSLKFYVILKGLVMKVGTLKGSVVVPQPNNNDTTNSKTTLFQNNDRNEHMATADTQVSNKLVRSNAFRKKDVILSQEEKDVQEYCVDLGEDIGITPQILGREQYTGADHKVMKMAERGASIITMPALKMKMVATSIDIANVKNGIKDKITPPETITTEVMKAGIEMICLHKVIQSTQQQLMNITDTNATQRLTIIKNLAYLIPSDNIISQLQHTSWMTNDTYELLSSLCSQVRMMEINPENVSDTSNITDQECWKLTNYIGKLCKTNIVAEPTEMTTWKAVSSSNTTEGKSEAFELKEFTHKQTITESKMATEKSDTDLQQQLQNTMIKALAVTAEDTQQIPGELLKGELKPKQVTKIREDFMDSLDDESTEQIKVKLSNTTTVVLSAVKEILFLQQAIHGAVSQTVTKGEEVNSLDWVTKSSDRKKLIKTLHSLVKQAKQKCGVTSLEGVEVLTKIGQNYLQTLDFALSRSIGEKTDDQTWKTLSSILVPLSAPIVSQ